MRGRFGVLGAALAAAALAVHWFASAEVVAVRAVDQGFPVDLASAGTSQDNIDHTPSGLRLRAPGSGGAPSGGVQGFYVTSAVRTYLPVTRVRPVLSAAAPPGTDIMVEVRGQTSAHWTEWQEVTQQAGEVNFPAHVRWLQARITMEQHASGGSGPEVYGFRFLVTDAAPPEEGAAALAPTRSPRPTGTVRPSLPPSPTVSPTPTAPPGQPLSSRVYATRIGQLGDKTANGHTIHAGDRFVALPSRRALNADVRDTSYQVRICYARTGRCVVAPSWDVGPWNIRDDYWNPQAVREMWKDLPRGKPQAQAAYLEGYNGRLDDHDRRVLNPAGIDLSNRLFWQDLGMVTNDWVTVTYLWTAGEEDPR